MKTFFTADTHAGHVNMTKAGKNLCDRPFADVAEMNAALLEGINSVVTSKQRLVILGDILMGKFEESLQWLAEIRAAEIILVPGNHDRFSPAYHHNGDAATKREAFRLRYEAVRPGVTALRGEDEMINTDGSRLVEPVRSWEFCQLSDQWRGSPLDMALFSHFPYDGDSHGEDRYTELRPLITGVEEPLPLIHGHVHTEWQIKGRQFNVGVDVNDFKPVSEDVLADWVKSL